MFREQFPRENWGSALGSNSRTIDTHVRRLRAKLGAVGQVISLMRRFGSPLESATK